MAETVAAAGFDLEAALASLPACVRCRNRRIKCDTSLQACTNCERASEVCRYRDHVLDSTVSRPDLATLVARYRELIVMKQSNPNISQALQPVGCAEVDSNVAVPLAPSLHLSDPRSPDDMLFWGSSSILSKLGTAMVTLGRMPPPQMMLERPQGAIFDLLPRPDSSDAELPGKDLCRRLLRVYHTSLEPFYPMFGWGHLALLMERGYTPSPIQSEPILLLLLAVILQALSRVDHRLVEQAKAYHRSFERLASNQLKASSSIETLRCLLLRSLYMLLSHSLSQSWHLLGLAQGLLPELILELKAKNSLFLLVTCSSLEYQVAIAFGRPTVLAESLTLDALQDTDFIGHSPLAFLVYKLSSIHYAVSSFVETKTVIWEDFMLQSRERLGLWITEWNIAVADVQAASGYTSWLRTSGSVMYDQCLLEIIWKASQASNNKGEIIGVARRFIGNLKDLYTFASTLEDPLTDAELNNGFEISIFPFFWTYTHAICNACLILLQSQDIANVSQPSETDSAIEKGLSLVLALDPSQTLFRTIWSLQNTRMPATNSTQSFGLDPGTCSS